MSHEIDEEEEPDDRRAINTTRTDGRKTHFRPWS